MNRFVLTADWHLGLSLNSKEMSEGSSLYLETLENVDRIIDYVSKNAIDTVVIAGDLFHSNHPTSRCYKDVILRLNRLEELAYVYVLLGNHELLMTGSSALSPLKEIRWNRVKIVDSTTVVDDFLFVPFVRGEVDLSKVKAKYVVTHNVIEGAVVGIENIFLPVEHNISKVSEEVKYVFAGHVHKPQQFCLGSVKVFYAGSIVRCDFSEALDCKGFWDINVDTERFEFIELPVREYKQYNVPLKRAFDKSVYEDIGDAVVKVKVLANKHESLDIVSLKRFLYDCGAFFVKGIEIVNNEEPVMLSFEDLDYKTLLESYINSLSTDDRMKRLVKEEGVKVLEEVLRESF